MMSSISKAFLKLHGQTLYGIKTTNKNNILVRGSSHCQIGGLKARMDNTGLFASNAIQIQCKTTGITIQYNTNSNVIPEMS